MKDDDFLREMRARFDAACEADKTNREKAIEDLRFVFDDDGQWEDEVKELRKGRPCYTFNKLRGAVRQVVNDQRQARPGIKVRSVDGTGGTELANIYTGLIRNIESVSNADFAYDNAFEYAVVGGYGAWRVTTRYADDGTFDQELVIKPIRNPFTTYFDPAAKQYDKRDGKFVFVTEMLTEKEFDKRYPKATRFNFDSAGPGESMEGWYEDKSIRVAEYWIKKPVTKTLLLLSDGAIIEADKDVALITDELAASGIAIERQRKVETHEVCQYVVSGNEVLEGPYQWAGKYIPVVPCFGEMIDIEGELMWMGLIRNAKDAQRSYNYHRSTMIELIDLQPKSPLFATPEQIKGLEKYWKEVNRKNLPFILYNPGPNGQKPFRERPADIPAAYLQESRNASDDIKATTGIYDASLGERSNETSGRAILARQREGDVSTFAFMDNLARSIQYTGEILVDAIPHVYDTERVVRIVGEDGAEKFEAINREVIDAQTGTMVRMHDLSSGRYDVTVTAGPSYTTRRLEAAETLLQLMQARPEMGLMLADVFVKNLDMPNQDEVHKRVRKYLIQQGIAEPESEEEVPPPNPQQQQQMEAALRRLLAEVQGKELDNAEKAQQLELEPIRQQAEIRKIVEETATLVMENMARQGLIAQPPPAETRMTL